MIKTINLKKNFKGDSGGGLYVEDAIENRKRFVVAGVTSFGIGCARPRLPGYVILKN